MNDEVIARANELIKTIKDDPMVKEYMRLKEEMETNPEILSLKENIMLAKIQKLPLEEIIAAEQLYKNHPIVANFFALQEEVNALLEEIKNILE